jgi:hypothetical protein
LLAHLNGRGFMIESDEKNRHELKQVRPSACIGCVQRLDH